MTFEEAFKTFDNIANKSFSPLKVEDWLFNYNLIALSHSHYQFYKAARLVSHSNIISKYIKNVSITNKATAYEYLRRLTSFKNFISNAFDALTVDELIRRRECNRDVFGVINEYGSYLSNTNISTNTIKRYVITVKNFLECHDIDISPRKFTLKIKLPKSIRISKEALAVRIKDLDLEPIRKLVYWN
ncbi:MAG: hypothetical protein WBP64_11050 [Nitrososphaeraceae archaeon]